MDSDHFSPDVTETTSPMDQQPAAEGPQGLARLFSVIIAPRATFQALAQRPQPWVGVLAVVLAMWVGSAAISHISGPEQMKASLNGPFGERLSQDEDYLQRIEDAAHPSLSKRVLTGAGGGLGGAAVFAVGAVFYWLACLAVGGKMGFKRTLDVVFLASWIGAGLGMLLTVPLVLAKGSAMTVGYSLAPLLGLFGKGADSSSLLFHSLQSFTNFFAIWQLILLAIGFSVVHHLSTARAWIAAAVPWALGYGLSLAMMAIFM
jgi:hypothetical protein